MMAKMMAGAIIFVAVTTSGLALTGLFCCVVTSSDFFLRIGAHSNARASEPRPAMSSVRRWRT